MSNTIYDVLTDVPELNVTKETKLKIKQRPKFLGRKLQILDNGQPDLSIVSYNILCSKYCKDLQFPYCNPKDLYWENRRDRILGELLSYGADILCLQEVDRYDYLYKAL